MKRKILSVLGVLMAVLMSTAAFSACSKAPAGAENSGGSGESLSESGAQTSTEGESKESIQKITAIVLSDSFATYGIEPTFSGDFAKASFLGYFAPMLVTLSVQSVRPQAHSVLPSFSAFSPFHNKSITIIVYNTEILLCFLR